MHLAEASQVGIQIYEDKIPIDPSTVSSCEELNLSPIMAALNGGEDYELLFTIPLEKHEQIKEMPGISIIGHVTDKASGKQMVTHDGQSVELKAQGWQGI